MSEPISIHQIGQFNFTIESSLSDATTFVKAALSKLDKVVLMSTPASTIQGEYKFAGGELMVPFSFNLTQAGENLIMGNWFSPVTLKSGG